MEFKDPIVNLAGKYSLVVRDFPPGCGTRPFELKKDSARKTKFLSLSEIMQPSALQGKRKGKQSDARPAREVAATLTVAPSLPGSSSGQLCAERLKMFELLKMFRDMCTEMIREKRASFGEKANIRRIDLKAWAVLKNKKRFVSRSEPHIGRVPGVEIGDRFYYRVELLLVDLHRYLEGGIDYYKTVSGEIVAVSLVASGETDSMTNPDELTYIGSGGISSHDKFNEDQKLVRGNLALMNSIHAEAPIRVIRKVRDCSRRDREVMKSTRDAFVYDGLYKAKSIGRKRGENGQLMFEFKLQRIPGQPPITRFRG